MYDRQVSEIREALLAVLSTAASMGIDVELLGHLAAAGCWTSRLRVETKFMRPVRCTSWACVWDMLQILMIRACFRVPTQDESEMR